MSESALKAELMSSLGRLVRGLSALFWGLPLALLVCVKTATSNWLRPMGIVPPLVVTGLLAYGLWQLGHFQKQERVWHRALDRAKLLGVVNVGLSPFLYWWNQMPQLPFYSLAVAILLVSSVMFLFNLNHVMQRLAAMLPDETLRAETNFFTALNLYLLLGLILLATAYVALQRVNSLPDVVIAALRVIEVSRSWLVVLLVLVPIAMTMTLIWKIKEAILASVFGQET